MSSVKRKFSGPVRMIGAAIAAIAIVIVGIIAVFGPGQNDADGATDPRTVALNQGMPFYDPSSSTTPTPSVTASTITSSPAATLSSTPTVTTSAPEPTITLTPPDVEDEGTPMIIGALSINIPSDYKRTDPNGLQSVEYVEFFGPDQTVISGRYYEPILLRVSSKGIMTIPDDLASLMEGVCPFGGGEVEFVPNPPGSDEMPGTKSTLEYGRETYRCGGYTFTYASWSTEDGFGNRLDADYYFVGDRRPVEVTEALKKAKVLD